MSQTNPSQLPRPPHRPKREEVENTSPTRNLTTLRPRAPSFALKPHLLLPSNPRPPNPPLPRRPILQRSPVRPFNRRHVCHLLALYSPQASTPSIFSSPTGTPSVLSPQPLSNDGRGTAKTAFVFCLAFRFVTYSPPEASAPKPAPPKPAPPPFRKSAKEPSLFMPKQKSKRHASGTPLDTARKDSPPPPDDAPVKVPTPLSQLPRIPRKNAMSTKVMLYIYISR
ncbi:hypothetical protein BDV93DRAFT_28679 [Ceratobasidium sp. AG-I]|nr:hypothetical protein BDV93DRAFT_28679 [Ceratobasidium sp. AG-I]